MWARNLKVKKVTEDRVKKQDDKLVLEQYITLKVEGKPDATFVTTRQHEQALVVGHMLSEGWIHCWADIHSLQQADTCFTAALAAPSEPVPAEEAPRLSRIDVFHLSAFVQERAFLYKDTAVTHSASLSDGKEIVYFAEDIEHHNAINKVLGLACEDQAGISSKTLFTTGRVDHVVIQKALQVGIRWVVSRTGVTDKAFDLAKEHDITVIGFARGKRFNVYTNEAALRL